MTTALDKTAIAHVLASFSLTASIRSKIEKSKKAIARFRSVKELTREETFVELDAALRELARAKKDVVTEAKKLRDPLNKRAKEIKSNSDEVEDELKAAIAKFAERVYAFAEQNSVSTCVRRRETVKYVVADASILPFEDGEGNSLWKVDQTAVNQAMKKGAALPGVRIEADVSFSVVS